MSIYLATVRKPLSEIKDILHKYNTGVEIQYFIGPQNLDNPGNIIDEVLEFTSSERGRSMHAPFLSMNPASEDYKIRNVAKERFSQAFDIAKKLQVTNMVFHTGKLLQNKPTQGIINRFGEFWNEFLKDKHEDIEIHFENVFEPDWEYLKEFIDVIEYGNISVCLDLGHANARSNQDVEKWIKGFKDKIKYVHMHNNYGDDDSHFGLNRGTIDMYKVLSQLKEYSSDAIWTIETTAIEESMNWLVKHKFYDVNSCT